MNKYELTVVVSAKLDDEGRTAEVEKVKALIEKFGGTITKIEEAGKKKFRRCQKHSITSSILTLKTQIFLAS